MPYNKRIEIRVSEEERKLFEEAAWIKRRKLTEWARHILVITAKAQIERGPSSDS